MYIGSCSLHVVHERFEKGAKESGWNLGNILHSLWQIFHGNFLLLWQNRCKNFFLKFQTEAPMTPILALSLKDLLFTIMGRFFEKRSFRKN